MSWRDSGQSVDFSSLGEGSGLFEAGDDVRLAWDSRPSSSFSFFPGLGISFDLRL